MKIVVIQDLEVPEEQLSEIIKPIQDQGHEVVVHPTTITDIEEQKEAIKDAEVVIVGNMPLTGEVIRSADNLKYLAVAFTGYDHIDMEACKEKGIRVSNASGYANINVAELAIGGMLTMLRKIVHLDKTVREGGMPEIGKDLGGRTVGVIGTGAIGYRSCQLLDAFGCDILAYDVFENPKAKELGVEYVELDELLKRSELITIHTPLLESTRGLIGREQLEMMREDAFLINIARGPIIDMEALPKALEEGLIAGAFLDVFDMEPPIPSDYPILGAPNTVMLPHIGWYTVDACVRRANITFGDNVQGYIDGDLQNVIL